MKCMPLEASEQDAMLSRSVLKKLAQSHYNHRI